VDRADPAMSLPVEWMVDRLKTGHQEARGRQPSWPQIGFRAESGVGPPWVGHHDMSWGCDLY